MYYYDEVTANIENLLMDFIVYRKNIKAKSLGNTNKTQHEVGKGRAYYKNNYFGVKASQVTPEPTQKKEQPSQKFPIPLDKVTNNIPEEINEEYISLLFDEINSMLMPYVMEALNSYEYPGSPVYDEQIDKETLAQIVDDVLERARQGSIEVDEILSEPQRQTWVRFRLLRSIIESLVITELFYRRKPIYRKYPNIGE